MRALSVVLLPVVVPVIRVLADLVDTLEKILMLAGRCSCGMFTVTLWWLFRVFCFTRLVFLRQLVKE